MTLTQLIAVSCFIGVISAQNYAPLPVARIPHNENARESYRESVAKSIRENIARQKLLKNQETVIYYGNEQPQFRPQQFQAPPRLLEQRQQFEQVPQNVPRIRIPVHVPKRTQHISPSTQPPKVYREEIPDYVDEVTEQIPVTTTTTTTTTQAPVTTRRPLPSRINFDEAFARAAPVPNVRSKKPHTPIIPDTPQVFSNDVETKRRFYDDEEEDQAKSAHYQFSSSVSDTINDNSMTRTETREGTALTGMFSYSDGFFKRTVHYRADENGYRVINEDIEPIGDGPQYNPEGKADVSSSLAGSYSITADDIRRPLRQEKERRRL